MCWVLEFHRTLIISALKFLPWVGVVHYKINIFSVSLVNAGFFYTKNPVEPDFCDMIMPL